MRWQSVFIVQKNLRNGQHFNVIRNEICLTVKRSKNLIKNTAPISSSKHNRRPASKPEKHFNGCFSPVSCHGHTYRCAYIRIYGILFFSYFTFLIALLLPLREQRNKRKKSYRRKKNQCVATTLSTTAKQPYECVCANVFCVCIWAFTNAVCIFECVIRSMYVNVAQKTFFDFFLYFCVLPSVDISSQSYTESTYSAATRIVLFCSIIKVCVVFFLFNLLLLHLYYSLCWLFDIVALSLIYLFFSFFFFFFFYLLLLFHRI